VFCTSFFQRQRLRMSSLIDSLVAVCDPAPGNQIRKVGLVGKDCQLLVDIFQIQAKIHPGGLWTSGLRWWMRRRLGIMSGSYSLCDQKVCRSQPRTFCGRGLCIGPPVLPNLRIWLYQYHSDSNLSYRNSLERGIVHSIKDSCDHGWGKQLRNGVLC
jgi:hypothetical protein